jgi:hypothetical protein
VIQVGTSQFRYLNSQLAFLSRKALKHFRHTKLLFEINLPNHFGDQKFFGIDDLISYFNSIDSPFHSQTEINLIENNFHVFGFLSKFFDKKPLSKVCKEVSSNCSPVFKLSSKNFKFLYENDLCKLSDFQLIVNGRTFDINYSLFCCISDKFQTMNCQEKIGLTIPSQHLPCLISFLAIFKDLPFYFEEYSLESVSYLINLLGLSSLSQFICKNLPPL